MTQQVFADYIGTTPATLSGIFNDRTRPTINIVEAIKKKIPDINTDWLLFGSGEMYVAPTPSEDGLEKPGDGEGRGSQNYHESMLDFSGTLPGSSLNGGFQAKNSNSVRNTHKENVTETVKIIDKNPRRVTEIRVYYDDQTWESFVPSQK